MKKFLALIVSMLFTGSIYANQLNVEGRLINNSCGYWTSTSVDFKFIYQNEQLESTSEVFLVYGKSEFDNAANELRKWQNQNEIKLVKSELTNRWQTSLVDIIIAQRGYPQVSNQNLGLQFVLKVVKQSGEIFYVKGSNAIMGYYEIPLSTETFSMEAQGCINSENDIRGIPFADINPIVQY